MLRVNFINSNNVSPKSDKANSVSPASSTPLTKVTYTNAWNGIDIVYEAEKGSLMKSTYYVNLNQPNALADSIRLKYNRPVSLDKNNNLSISYDTGTITESAPIAWQIIDGKKNPVSVSYTVKSQNEVGFALGNYVPNVPVVIDPTYTWNGFYGETANDYVASIVLDKSGNIYATGYSAVTWGSPIRAYTSSFDAQVIKLDPAGNLLWNTFLGAAGDDYGYWIAVDGSGNVYVGGLSPNTWGTPVRAYTLSIDAFVAKLDTNGNLLWNTFLGGNGNDSGAGAPSIGLDGVGNIYLSGTSPSAWGSPTVRAYTSGTDDFIAKLDNTTGTMIWNTFIGGTGTDSLISGAFTDTNGNTYICGSSDATWGSPVRAYSSGVDLLVAKVDNTGNLVWNTFLGGTGAEYCFGTGLDKNGNIYVSARSNATWGTPVRAFSVGNDAEVAKLDASGILLWNTFIGGAGTDFGRSLAVDDDGNSYAVGWTDTAWGSPIRAYTSGNDAYATKIDTNGTLLWSTFLGGTGSDIAFSAALDSYRNIYIAGYSTVSWGTPFRAYTSGFDSSVVKLYNNGTLATTPHTITATVGANGFISPSDATSVNDGASPSFTITPATHYHTVDVLVDSVSQGAITSYTFTNVTTTHTISATFSKIIRHGVPPIIRTITPPAVNTPPITTPIIPSTNTVSTTYNFGTTTLKNGSTGEPVKELQRFLNNILKLNLTIDGKLGLKTIAIIKQWQKAHSLIPDGVVGAKTKEKMLKSI